MAPHGDETDDSKPPIMSRYYFLKTKVCHSALKLEKKCNIKSTKKTFLPIHKWQKINFCTRKKFKTTKNPGFFFQSKNCIFGNFKLFSSAKIDFFFLPFLK